jgi:hypothetical protein
LKKLAAWVSPQRGPTEKPRIDTSYAREGEVVTCENGHPICEFIQTVYVGDTQDPENQLGFWHQPKPEVGQNPVPRCSKCGGRWYIAGGIMHFKDGWRDPMGLIEQYGFPEE